MVNQKDFDAIRAAYKQGMYVGFVVGLMFASVAFTVGACFGMA